MRAAGRTLTLHELYTEWHLPSAHVPLFVQLDDGGLYPVMDTESIPGGGIALVVDSEHESDAEKLETMISFLNDLTEGKGAVARRIAEFLKEQGL